VNTSAKLKESNNDGTTDQSIPIARVQWRLDPNSVAQETNDWSSVLDGLGYGEYSTAALGFSFVSAFSARDVLLSANNISFDIAGALWVSEVTIQGNPVQLQTLSVDVSNLNDPELVDRDSVSVRWLRDGLAIPSATADVYELTQDDVGAQISVQVSYTDGVGGLESVISDPTAEVSNVNDDLVGTVAIVGTASQGEQLTADPSGLIDPDGLGGFSL